MGRPAAHPPSFVGGMDESDYREILARFRLGQGAFRIMVTEDYGRACAITGNHTLPVLEGARIRPYGESGPHLVANGLVLRADLHKLTDDGYLLRQPCAFSLSLPSPY